MDNSSEVANYQTLQKEPKLQRVLGLWDLVFYGIVLIQPIAAILFIACLGSAIAGQVGASRLLFSMGRDGVLPKKNILLPEFKKLNSHK